MMPEIAITRWGETAQQIVARGQRFTIPSWTLTGAHWDAAEDEALALLCRGRVSPDKAADALGRNPTSIAHRAQLNGLVLPKAWALLRQPKRTISPPRVQLAYPYVIKPRDEHAELLAVNSIVPRYLEGREDVCQEIMIALWEKKITLAQLEANAGDVRAFVRQFKRQNFEASGYAVSLDLPMRDGRSWHDVIADPATLNGFQ